MSMEYVRKTYNVPAKRGGKIRYWWLGSWYYGTITSATNYIRVRMDGEKTRRVNIHPTDINLQYL
jgi:hypothetical protein